MDENNAASGDPTEDLVSVVVPVHNEAGSIEELSERIIAAMRQEDREFEVILVDDGSNDGSTDQIRELSARHGEIRGVILEGNFGQSAAMRAGIERARGDLLVTLDADLQNPPEEIPRLIRLIDPGVDIVAGVRSDRHDGSLRRAASRLANRLIRRVTGVELADIGCTLRVYRSGIVRRVPLFGDAHRLLLVHCALDGARILQVPVSHRPRVNGRSHYGLGRTPRVVLDLLVLKFLRSFLVRPMHLFGGVGLMLLLLGIGVLGVAVMFRLLQGVSLISTPLPLLGSLLGTVGILSILLGVLAELLVRLYLGAGLGHVYLVAEEF